MHWTHVVERYWLRLTDIIILCGLLLIGLAYWPTLLVILCQFVELFSDVVF